MLDVVGDRKSNIADLQADDVRNFGIVLLQTIRRSTDACLVSTAIPTTLDSTRMLASTALEPQRTRPSLSSQS
jgi:hypothetical protein